MTTAEHTIDYVSTLSPQEASDEAMRRMSPMLRELRTVLDCPCRRYAPEQVDVDAVRDLLDLMGDFPSNDQRARYLLSCNWMRDRGAQAARRAGPCSACEAKVAEKLTVLALVARAAER